MNRLMTKAEADLREQWVHNPSADSEKAHISNQNWDDRKPSMLCGAQA